MRAVTYRKAPVVTKVRLYGIGCLLIVVGILVACLWPFHAPINQVTWLAHRNGLRFGHYGTIVSQGAIDLTCQSVPPGCTIEIWLRPKFLWKQGSILAFYDPRHRGGFWLRQSNGSFIVDTEPWKREDVSKSQEFFAGNTFARVGFIFLTLTSGLQGTRAYIDGVLVRPVQKFRIPADDFRGRLVVANSPVLNDSWSGELKAIALYSDEMTAEQVLRNYDAWMRTGKPDRKDSSRAVALYLFDGHSGSVIHNRAGANGDLYIPKRFSELHHTLLRQPWDEFAPNWGYLEDVLINIAGFIPLGFFCYAYLSLIRGVKRAVLVTVIFGCLLSLTVEILQAYLPTRDSGMTDIITNTSGTAVGILFYRFASLVCGRLVQSRRAWVRHVAALFADSSLGKQGEAQPATTMR